MFWIPPAEEEEDDEALEFENVMTILGLPEVEKTFI